MATDRRRVELSPLKPHLRLLTVAEVAELLRVTEGCVRRMVSERRIPFRKIGRAVRFNIPDLERWSTPEGGRR